MATNLRGIRRFLGKIEQLRTATLEKILEEMLEEGQRYAYSLYQQSKNPSNPEPDDDNVTVTYEIDGDRGILRANSNIIAYLEYGYGIEGEGTYDGKLPTQPITFDAPYMGEITVDGWTYYYDNPFTKDGAGWTHDGKYFVGEPAEAQMWKTAMYLRDNAEAIIRRVISSDLKKVKA